MIERIALASEYYYNEGDSYYASVSLDSGAGVIIEDAGARGTTEANRTWYFPTQIVDAPVATTALVSRSGFTLAA